MEKAITNIFIDCQKSIASHPKLIKKLVNIYLKSDFENFCAFFIQLLKQNLIHSEKFPIIERTLTFVSNFCTAIKSDEKETQHAQNKIQDDDDDDYECDIDPFLVKIFEFLLKNHEANSKAVRYRVCQLINKILNSMGEQACIDDDLYSTIYDTMLQRLMDIIPPVRVQAILALSRLQDPQNKECPIIKAYLFHLSMDPNPEVRKAVLSNIAITIQTLPEIIERIKDTRDTVRRQAYVLLAQKVHIRSLTIAQRVLLISEGLKDRSQMVRQAVKKNLLQSWLRLLDGSIIDFLKSLDVEASADSAELALNSLFEDVPCSTLLESFDLLNDKKLIPVEKLTAESAIFWKCLAKHYRSEKADEYLEEILPDLSVFCDYFREFILQEGPDEEDPQDTAVRMMEKDFVCQQLIALTTVFDLADEVGRKNLCSLVRQFFLNPSTGEGCLKCLSQVFAELYPPIERVEKLAEIISEIQQPLEPDESTNKELDFVAPTPKSNKLTEEDERKKKIQVAQISVKLNQIRDELEDCVRSLNLERAVELKKCLKDLEEEKSTLLEECPTITPRSTPVIPSSQNKMPEEEELKLIDDPDTLARCSLILCEVLTYSDIKVFGSILRSLHDNLIIPCLKSEDFRVRKYAVRGLALTCLISKELAKQHLLLFIQISRMDVEEIQIEALRGLFDFWLLYGVEEFNSATECVNELPAFMDSPIINPKDGSNSDTQNFESGNLEGLIAKMLETDIVAARTVTAEGLCKLLLTSRITSSKLMSLLIILWYNPTTEEDQMLRHMLGVFFPLYASYGGSNQEAICNALIPTIHEIFNASARSPLYNIDVEEVITFMISITSPSIVSNKSKEMVNAHDTLVFTICSEVLAFPERDYTRPLVKCLHQLVLSPNQYSCLRQLLILTEKIKKKLCEKSALNYLNKFIQNIENHLESAPKKEEEDNQPENTITDSEDGEGQNLTSSRKKRVLYSTQSDLEFVGDFSEITNEKTIISETEDEEEKEVVAGKGKSSSKKLCSEQGKQIMKKNELVEELEITTVENASTSDMQAALSDNAQGSSDERDEQTTLKGGAFEDTEDDCNEDNEDTESSTSSSSKSPPRKSPRFQGQQRTPGKRKFKGIRRGESTSPSILSESEVSSSSQSFHSVRSEASPKQEKRAGVRTRKSEAKTPKRRSLRVLLERLNIPVRRTRSGNRSVSSGKKGRRSLSRARSRSASKRRIASSSSSTSSSISGQSHKTTFAATTRLREHGSTSTENFETPVHSSLMPKSTISSRKRHARSSKATPPKLFKITSKESESGSASSSSVRTIKTRSSSIDDSLSSSSNSSSTVQECSIETENSFSSEPSSRNSGRRNVAATLSLRRSARNTPSNDVEERKGKRSVRKNK